MKKDTRTLYTKYNLAVADVANRDAKDVALHRVHLAADGSTVASNGRALMAVSPASKTKSKSFPELDEGNAEPPEEGVGLTLEDVRQLKRNFPTDKRPSLQYAQMTRCSPAKNPTTVALMTTDGKRHQMIKVQPARGKFPKWEGILAKARQKATRARVCVDRMSLVKLLQAIDRASPDAGGYNPVFIEIGGPEDAIVARSHNYESGQTVIGMVTPLAVVDWLEESSWEKETLVDDSEEAKPAKREKRGPRRVEE
jgi:hypothetical protein